MRILPQFHHMLIYVLLGSATIEAMLGHWLDIGVMLAATAEGLPAGLTIMLAIGPQSMTRRNAVVRRWSTIETRSFAMTDLLLDFGRTLAVSVPVENENRCASQLGG